MSASQDAVRPEVADESGYAERLEAAGILKDERIAGLIRDIENLHAKAEHRSVIDQAKGVIMNATKCGPDAAFAVLVAESQRQNRKLWEIAAELAAAQDQSDPGSTE
jgi:AmiR/NasT family two-component response regulator